MIEVIGATAKWLQLVANMLLVGAFTFFAITAYDRAGVDNQWLDRLERALPGLTVASAILLIVVLAITAAEVTDVAGNAFKPDAWWGVLKNTWLGKVWTARMGLTLLVLLPATAYTRIAPSARWRYLLCAGIAAAVLAAGAFSSHAAAEEAPWLAIGPYALHIVLAAVWLGGLSAFLAVLYGSSPRESPRSPQSYSATTAITRFSAMALPVMAGIVATGLIVANNQIESRYAALVSTDYGWFLVSKLGLLCAILVIASYARFAWLPSLEKGDPDDSAWRPLRTGVSVEFGLAILLVLAATLCASSIPAKHAVIDQWPYSFRFSLKATLELPETITNLVVAGVLVFAAAAAAVTWVGGRVRWSRAALSASIILTVASACMTLYAIATAASVDTYRGSAVPFDAISIARGAHLFAENCTMCHGPQGKGNGPLATSLPKSPADLLTEPHTARHLAGDLYHWIKVGIPAGEMPGFGHKLSEDDRWDVVNFLHVVSRGYESRILRTRVVPDSPSENLGAPDFSFVDQHGNSHTLKDYREKKSVLLVFFKWPEAEERLKTLQAQYAAIQSNEAEVIAIPWGGSAPDRSWAEKLPFPVAQGSSEIGETYAAFRRSLGHPDLFGAGIVPDRMELLVDRFGYLRGRWLPAQDETGWDDTNRLVAQLGQLRSEDEILPPAEDHVH